MEEDEDFEAYEARQRAEAAMKSKEQEDYDKAQGKGSGSGGETDDEDYDSEYDSQEDSDDNLDRDVSGDLIDNGGSSDDKRGTRDREDLRKTRLSQQDYNKRSQSAKVKKGKYGVTVPQPFSMMKADAMAKKGKSIRARKVEEMVNEKKMEE